MRPRGQRLWLVITGLLSGCAVTPLTNKIAVGDEAFIIVLGEAPDGNTDLFAAPAGGGKFYRLTFNRPVEDLPRLAPDGRSVAFIRRSTADDWSGAELVVLDLTTTGERTVALPGDVVPVERLGWSSDGSRIHLAGKTDLETGSLPGRLTLDRVGPEGAARADTATSEVLGDPIFALVRHCPDGGLCVEAGAQVTPLGNGVSEAIRWGPDSLATVENGQIEVRPLGGGRARRPSWTDPPRNLRHPTHNPGAGRRPPAP